MFNGFYDDLVNNQNDEKHLVVSLCSQELGIDRMSACNIQSVKRLGKPSEARNRPLLVTFYEHCTFYRNHILDLTYLLRKSPDLCVRHSVLVNPQLSKTELDEMKNRRQRRGEFSRRTNMPYAKSNNMNFKNNSRATTNYQSSSGSGESASNHQSSSVFGASAFKPQSSSSNISHRSSLSTDNLKFKVSMTNNTLHFNSNISTSVNQVSSLNPNVSSFVNNRTDCRSLQSSSTSEPSYKYKISCSCDKCEDINDLFSDCNDSLQLVSFPPTQSQTKTTSGIKH